MPIHPALLRPDDSVTQLAGFAGHWSKNTNLAWAFDNWFLNLFSRPRPFTHNGGGYATLSFIPTLGTMILGLIAGRLLRSDRTAFAKVRWLYAQFGLADRTEIEFFQGGHSMRLEGTVEFLHKHLNWPKPEAN